jgi:hypothetical protein
MGGYKAATVSPLVGTCGGAVVVEDAEASFLEANEQFSILSSRFICCCRHSRLQKALSPLQIKEEEKLLISLLIIKL